MNDKLALFQPITMKSFSQSHSKFYNEGFLCLRLYIAGGGGGIFSEFNGTYQMSLSRLLVKSYIHTRAKSSSSFMPGLFYALNVYYQKFLCIASECHVL